MSIQHINLEELSYLAMPHPTDPRHLKDQLIENSCHIVVKLNARPADYLQHEHFKLVSEKSIDVINFREYLLDDSWTLYHVEFPVWEDFGAPDQAEFNLLLNIIAQTQKHYPDTPLAVHCQGGQGRTGTFIGAHALSRLKYPPSAAELISTMREQYTHLIETEGQYAFVENFAKPS